MKAAGCLRRSISFASSIISAEMAKLSFQVS